jgi:antirestriction protein ArdC
MCIRQTITDKIITIMESGAAHGGPRWTQSQGHGLPRNAKTGDLYRGVNVLLLWSEAAERGYSSNLWLTYKQAEGMGAQVRKGEKSVMCVFFDKVKKVAQDDQEETFYPMAKPFWLFNAAQIDGLPESLTTPAETRAFNPVSEAEQVLASTGARIRHGFDGAFYMPGRDEICLPDKGRFTSEPNYYATALHELGHWTGHESRLNRTFGKRFGDDAYAMEELVAELSAAFSMGYLEMVDGTIEKHASYLDSWIKCLKADKGAIFTAASQAAKASDFVMAACSKA